jgi:hypothetical protein
MQVDINTVSTEGVYNLIALLELPCFRQIPLLVTLDCALRDESKMCCPSIWQGDLTCLGQKVIFSRNFELYLLHPMSQGFRCDVKFCP